MNLSTLQHTGSLLLGMAAPQLAFLTTSTFPSTLKDDRGTRRICLGRNHGISSEHELDYMQLRASSEYQAPGNLGMNGLQNPRMVCVGRDLKGHLVSPQHLLLDQVPSNPVQPNLGASSYPGQPVSEPHHPHGRTSQYVM